MGYGGADAWGMASKILSLLVLAAAALLLPCAGHAQSRAVINVSVTVVNTCFFGQTARCALPGTTVVAMPAPTSRPDGKTVVLHL